MQRHLKYQNKEARYLVGGKLRKLQEKATTPQNLQKRSRNPLHLHNPT